MPKRHVVRPGENILQLAHAYGHLAETIWQHGSNADLRSKRKNMHTLLPGDVVDIPEPEPKKVSGRTDKRHIFRRKDLPTVLRVQMLENGKPRKGQRYLLTVDGVAIGGVTDGRGMVEQPIAPDSREGRLVIGPDRHEVPFNFGRVNPIEEDEGIDQRLRNLGYPVPQVQVEGKAKANAKAKASAEARAAALRTFQEDEGLPVTGKVDGATRNRLEQLHDRTAAPQGRRRARS